MVAWMAPCHPHKCTTHSPASPPFSHLSAYSAGYEAASEAELHATLWGGTGARGSGKRKRAEEEEGGGGGARRRRSSAAAGQKHPRLALLLNKHSQT